MTAVIMLAIWYGARQLVHQGGLDQFWDWAWALSTATAVVVAVRPGRSEWFVFGLTVISMVIGRIPVTIAENTPSAAIYYVPGLVLLVWFALCTWLLLLRSPRS